MNVIRNTKKKNMNLYIKYIFKRLNETKLPVKETSIAHCKFKIWSEFVMKNMGDY